MRMSNEQLLRSIKEENKELKKRIDEAIETSERAVLKIDEMEGTIISIYGSLKKLSKKILKILDRIEDDLSDVDYENNEDPSDNIYEIIDVANLTEES